MIASSRPHDIVGPFLSNNLQCFVVDVLWVCGQRDCVVHQIHSPSLPAHKFGVAARSLGRDHAPWRIDLYTAGTLLPLTTIGIHVSREPEHCGGDQTTTGSHRTINLAGRRPPHRVRGKLNPLFLTLYCCALRYHAVLEKSPKCNCQPSRKSDNADLAAAHSRAGEALTPPCRQRALRLVAQPGPRQLDQRLPRQFRSGLADAAISTDVATRVWARRQANERCKMSSALELTVINFGNQQYGGYRADTAECRQALRFRLFREGTVGLEAPNGNSLLNRDCRIYREIAQIADVMRDHEPLRFGRMYYRQISGDGVNFGLPYGSTYTLAFSRLLYGQEVLITYNVSDEPRQDCLIVDAALHPEPSRMTFLYGKTGTVQVQSSPSGARFVQLDLDGHEFVILA